MEQDDELASRLAKSYDAKVSALEQSISELYQPMKPLKDAKIIMFGGGKKSCAEGTVERYGLADFDVDIFDKEASLDERKLFFGEKDGDLYLISGCCYWQNDLDWDWMMYDSFKKKHPDDLRFEYQNAALHKYAIDKDKPILYLGQLGVRSPNNPPSKDCSDRSKLGIVRQMRKCQDKRLIEIPCFGERDKMREIIETYFKISQAYDQDESLFGDLSRSIAAKSKLDDLMQTIKE